MGRKVYVSGDMATDPRILDVAEDDPQAALLWPWIIMALDDWGRAEADPRALKFELFPGVATVTRDTIGAALEAYARHGLVVLYEAEGRTWMAVPPARWWRWQTHIHQTKRQDDSGSHCPRPPDPAGSEVDGTVQPARVVVVSESGAPAGSSGTDPPSAESRGSPRDAAESRASLPPSAFRLPPSLPPTHVPSAESARDEREPAKQPDPPASSRLKPFEADFNPLWQQYPRRMYRAKALRAFQALMRRTICDRRQMLADLERATEHYAAAKAQTPKEHIMHGSTWFGPDEPWRDWIAGNPEPTSNSNGSGSGAVWVDPVTAALNAERAGAAP